ncbi:MAG: hypothetical protein K8W52_28665 [Deltaproteobacteria bacterium]|nr:hypothetical protein [Deltaproteobacteria bacterium]
MVAAIVVEGTKLEFETGYWSGALALPAFAPLAGAKAVKAFVEIEAVDGEDDDAAPPALPDGSRAGLAWLATNQAAVAVAVREAVTAAYPRLRERNGDAVAEGLMPAPTAANPLPVKLEISSIAFHDLAHRGLPYYGIMFDCPWDREHGLGLMMHGARVVELGGADTAILAWIATRDMGGGAKAAKPAARKPAPTAKGGAKPAAVKVVAKKPAAVKKVAKKPAAVKKPAAKKATAAAKKPAPAAKKPAVAAKKPAAKKR